MLYTPEATALLPSGNAPYSLAQFYADQVSTNGIVTRQDVQKVYAAYRMVWEWEMYKSAVLAGDVKGAYELGNTEGVIFGVCMDCDPSDVDIKAWVEFLDATHSGADWWSII